MQTFPAPASLAPKQRTHGRRFGHRPHAPTRDVAAADLLRALGVLQELADGKPIPTQDRDILALEAGLNVMDLWWHIAAGVRAGDIAVDDEHALTLTPQGMAWWHQEYADW